MKQKIIKSFTLFLFIGLISAFVIYRSGINEDDIQSSPNGGKVNTKSTNKTDSVKKITVMPSSKVLILTDKNIIQKDTTKSIKAKDTLHIKDFDIMSSSKSGIIFKPKTKIDTTKTKPKK